MGLPSKERIQGFGTAQSQSSMGQVVQARGTSISPKVLHRRLLLHGQARAAKVWVKDEDRAHGPRL